jgi:multidrug efflux pump subunit AcrA (membrane-fusion protein)
MRQIEIHPLFNYFFGKDIFIFNFGKNLFRSQKKHIMFKKSQIYLILTLLAYSCSPNIEMATYTVSQGDFVNALLVEGAVEPVQTTIISSPRYVDGVVQYLVEDGVYVEKDDIVCIIEFQELQNRYDQNVLGLESAEANLNKTKADLNMQYALLEAQETRELKVVLFILKSGLIRNII